MAKIPKQLRITLKQQNEYERDAEGGLIVREVVPLGFANVYEPHVAAYAKRQKTQDDWAYAEYRSHFHTEDKLPYFERDGKIWLNHFEWVDRVITHIGEEIVPERLQPRIIDNVPMRGFQIQKSVSRCSTSNKLWRILDPRGFELEITTGTMEDLILGGIITNGLIVDECVWATAKMLIRV